MHLRDPQTHETQGTLSGNGTTGVFHEWQQGDRQRRDDRLGLRTERVLRVGDDMWIQNSSGEVRRIHGLLARRQVTQDFIDSGDFLAHPEKLTYVGSKTLPDGRSVYELRVVTEGGEPYTIGIDAKSWLIDEESYIDHDSAETSTYSDFRVIDGMLIAFTEVDSDGDHGFDLTSHVSKVTVDRPIDPAVFAPLLPFVIQTSKPVSLPYEVIDGHPAIRIAIGGKSYRFLVDSGSQSDVIDPTLASALGLHPEGVLEISGAARTSALGIVDLPPMSIGDATLGPHVATVLDLSHLLRDDSTIAGILGFPFFGAAEVRLDPDTKTMLIAQPGTLGESIGKIEVDTDRELAEIDARVEQTPVRLLVDTGNNQELLVFESFVSAHPGLIPYVGRRVDQNSGVGGTNAAVRVMVGELDLGSVRMFNRYADVVLAKHGAFADQNDGGNVGFATLENFVMTFDLANRALYLVPAKGFDNGRLRARPDNSVETSWPPRGDAMRASSPHDDAADRIQHLLGAARGDRPPLALASLVFGPPPRDGARARRSGIAAGVSASGGGTKAAGGRRVPAAALALGERRAGAPDRR